MALARIPMLLPLQRRANQLLPVLASPNHGGGSGGGFARAACSLLLLRTRSLRVCVFARSDNEGFEIGIAKVLLYNEYLTSKVFFFRFA